MPIKKQRTVTIVCALLAIMMIVLGSVTARAANPEESDAEIIALLGSDEDGNRIFTLDAWSLYVKSYYGLDWDKKEYVNERNKFYLPETGEEILKPFLKKYDVYYRPIEEQQAEWEAFHGHKWGEEKPGFFRSLFGMARATVTAPCERCGTSISVTQGSWVRSCYRCTCNNNGCNRPGVMSDDDYSGEYNCRFDEHNNSQKTAAKYCWGNRHVRLDTAWSEGSSTYSGWQHNYCPEHACTNGEYKGAGCTGKAASGSVYCVACGLIYDNDKTPPANVRVNQESGWINHLNSVTVTATDESTPLTYRLVSGATTIQNWSANNRSSTCRHQFGYIILHWGEMVDMHLE